MQIRPFQPADQDAVIEIWNLCGLVAPWNSPERDIARKLARDPENFLVGIEDGAVIASVMAGYEGHRGWINYLAVRPEFQGRGHGKSIMLAAQELLLDLGCPKINLQIRRTNAKVIRFYESIGFAPDDVLSMGKRLIHDDPA